MAFGLGRRQQPKPARTSAPRTTRFRNSIRTLKLDTRYVKVLDIAEGNHLVKKVHSYRSFPLMSVVFNFLDILAHGRSESDILKEMAPNESAYRSLSRSWFSHSSLFEMLRKLAETDTTVVLTTDHGCVMSTPCDRGARKPRYVHQSPIQIWQTPSMRCPARGLRRGPERLSPSRSGDGYHVYHFAGGLLFRISHEIQRIPAVLCEQFPARRHIARGDGPAGCGSKRQIAKGDCPESRASEKTRMQNSSVLSRQ